MEHKKALWYDGHNCPDNEHYHQREFILGMKRYQPHLVKYVVRDVDKQIEKNLPQGSDSRWLVLCVHNEIVRSHQYPPDYSHIW